MPAQSDAARRPGQPWIKDRGALAGVIRELPLERVFHA